MPKVIAHTVIWLAERNGYVLREAGRGDVGVVAGEECSGWLAGRSSFAFEGKQGHLTLRKEARARKEGYWYAYRCQNQRTIKRYAGRTGNLTIARLEEIAEGITAAFADGRMQEEEWENGAEREAPHEVILTDSPLLAPKLRLPHLHSSMVARERLLLRLDACLEHKLTVVCAPAGFGKTTLVRQWIAAREERAKLSPVAWVSLDGDDNDLARFWRYILTAAQTWYAAPDQHILDLLLSATQPSYMKWITLEVVLTTFLNEVSRQNMRGLLVLEDYHVISDARIHDSLNFFLSHLPETLHVVLITRYEPPLPLARLRANGELNEIEAADLRFSAEETEEFLGQTVMVPLSTELLEQLATHLEGWAAGLRMLSLSLQGKTTQAEIDEALSTFRGSHRSVRDYFVSEVLHAQSQVMQDFLLRTSVLTRLSPSLCAAITGRHESAALLEAIERSNLFLEALDNAGGWYRYYALFAEAMQHEARRRLGEHELRALLYAASCWFEQHNMLPEAIEVAFKAEESERASDLVEQQTLVIEQRAKTLNIEMIQEYRTLRRWLEQVPQAILRQRPLLCLGYAIVLLLDREEGQQTSPAQLKLLEELLDAAEEGWRPGNDLVRLGMVVAFRAFLGYQQGRREQGLVWARQALDWLPETEPIWRGMALGTLGMDALQTGQLNEGRYIFEQVSANWEQIDNPHTLRGIAFLLGSICLGQGEVRQAAVYFRRARGQTGLQEDYQGFVAMQLGLAQVFYEWNDLEMLEQQLKEILDRKEQFAAIPHEIFQIPIELTLACLQQAHGETELAIERLASLLSQLHSYPGGLQFYFYQEALGWLVRLALLLGDRTTAQDWLHGSSHHHDLLALPSPDTPLLDAPADAPDAESGTPSLQSNADIPFPFQEQRTILEARLYLAQGEVDAVLALLNDLLPAAQRAGRGRNAFQIKLLMAQAYATRKQIPEARQLLLEGLEQGYAQGYRRAFLDEGEPIFHLLRDLYPHLKGPPLRGYVQSLLHTFAQTRSSQSTVVMSVPMGLFEPLSAQELRVLRLLAAGRSNREIADDLVVSINTVRTHVQSIYRKLNVNNRHAAGQTARQFQLI